MKELTPEDIKKIAHQYVDSGIKWHAHFLTPECKLNDTGRYMTLLECPTEQFLGVCLQDQTDKKLIGYLSTLLHGLSIESDESNLDASDIADLPTEAQTMLARAKELNTKNVVWHHHLLFSDCMYNKNQPNWTLMIEDPESDAILESITGHEPKETLRFLEPLFYAK